MIHVGCSSWLDPEFIKHWYPTDVRADERLAWYAENFDYVEVNSSFYAVPEKKAVVRWAKETPDDFVFDAKLHQALSRHNCTTASLPPHLRRGARGDEPVKLNRELEHDLVLWIKEQFQPLVSTGRFGAFLLQLSPSFTPKHRLTELEDLLEDLAPLPVAIEFRNKAWLADDTLRQHTIDFLADWHVALVGVDTPDIEDRTAMPTVDYVTTSSLAYLRLHGRNKVSFVEGKTVAERFSWEYTDNELEGIAARVKRLAEQATAVRVAANNNDRDFAPKAAAKLREMLGLPERKPRRTTLPGF